MITQYPPGIVGNSPIQLAYAQVTANQGGITTEADLTGLSVTVNVIAGHTIKITGSCRVQSSVADDVAELSIKEGATALNLLSTICRPASQDVNVGGSIVISPSGGSHTYKLTLQRQSGTGTLQMSAGSIAPAFILVEDITGIQGGTSFASAPLGTIGYAQVTASQGLITTLVDLTGLSVTVNVQSGRRIQVTGSVPIGSSVAADVARLHIREGSTDLQVRDMGLPNTGVVNYDIECSAILTPTTGTHTYKLAAERAIGTGNVTVNASTLAPAFILVEDIGT